MIWVAPSEKDQATGALETRLWAAASMRGLAFGWQSKISSIPRLVQELIAYIVHGLEFQKR